MSMNNSSWLPSSAMEKGMSRKAILSVEYNFWSPLFSKEVCPAPRLEHVLWQQCWLCHPVPRGGPQCQLLSGLWCFVFFLWAFVCRTPSNGSLLLKWPIILLHPACDIADNLEVLCCAETRAIILFDNCKELCQSFIASFNLNWFPNGNVQN